jgi:hypothetical protein
MKWLKEDHGSHRKGERMADGMKRSKGVTRGVCNKRIERRG